jgi:hypothetical protein
MPAEVRHLLTFIANEERLALLAEIGKELSARFPGRVATERNTGERPPAWSVRLSGSGLFATFGVIDATYFWTFDGGESCHYAKDKDVMRRLLTFELGRMIEKDPIQ